MRPISAAVSRKARMSQAKSRARQHGKQAGCVVLKFGGTSVEDAAALRRVVAIVAGRKEPVVVVVSALGGVTDQLLAASERAAGGELGAAKA